MSYGKIVVNAKSSVKNKLDILGKYLLKLMLKFILKLTLKLMAKQQFKTNKRRCKNKAQFYTISDILFMVYF